MRVLPFLLSQYTNIGGQAVIEGVMMRSPNAFVVAVRTPDGKIRIRRDQWFGLSKKLDFLKFPFLRGVLMLIETMANGVVSLNYSANVAMDEEMKERAVKKGQSLEEYEAEKKKKEKVNFSIFLTVFTSIVFGVALFVFLPHALALTIEKFLGADWGLDSFYFHLLDGTIKAFIFVMYVWLIGFWPDIRRVFQYHGAEHKSISTFESKEDLVVENAKKFTTLHPRCGTSFTFFLIFISIILFSVIFVFVPVGENLPFILKHIAAVLFKILLMFPIAGISYEIIKWAGKNQGSPLCRAVSLPGMALQKLTTREPDDSQLEVALASIKTVLDLEERFDLKSQEKKILSASEIDIEGLGEIRQSSQKLEDFLEN
ncbi:MAG: DUF1385 domain-containing protein [Bacteriovoracales bacterium]|nr:DUF1385 domain-containing protein [Bacteriovoracales bacterium]